MFREAASLAIRETRTLIRSGSNSIRGNTPDGWLSGQAPIPTPMWGFDDLLPVWWEAGGFALLPSVGRGLSLTSETLAGLPYRCYRDTPGGVQVPAPRWIADPQNAQRDGRTPGVGLPNPQPGPAFWGNVYAAAILHGNGLIYAPNRDPGGRPMAPLHLLRPGTWRWVPEEGCYHIGTDGTTRVWPEETILIRGKPPYDKHGFGVGVLRTYANALGIADALARYAASMYRTGIPYGYLSVTTPATNEQLRKLKHDWLDAHADERTIAVLGNGVRFEPVQVNPVDADLIRVADNTLRDIAHAMGLSAHDLDVQGTSNTYANVQDRIMGRRQFSLLQWALLFESAIEAHLPAGTSLKIALDGLERGTTMQRYQEHEIGLRAGFLTVDEVRAMEDLPPLPQPPPKQPQIEPAGGE